jgi:hypothetical protein
MIVNNVYEMSQRVIANIENRRLEPWKEPWVNISYVVKYNHSVFFDEVYYNSDIFKNTTKEIILDKYLDYFQQSNLKMNDEKKDEIFNLIIKIDNMYLVRSQNVICKSKFTTEPSSIRFLSITYNHPKMENPIVLEIPNEMYIIGNEILSMPFIGRMLKYQSSAYVFDNDYEIEILDNNIVMTNLKSHQYIRFGKEDYFVVDYHN